LRGGDVEVTGVEEEFWGMHSKATFCIRFWVVLCPPMEKEDTLRTHKHTQFFFIFKFIFLPVTKICDVSIIDGINKYEVYYLQEY